MNDILLALLSITTILVIYWLVVGQWKYNRMVRHPHKPKAVIFDMDGVIIDSLESWLEVFNSTRQHYKLPKITKKEFVEKIWGGSIQNDIQLYFKGKSIEEISNRYFSNIGKFKSGTKLNPHVKETLEKLKSKDIKLALVTNTYKKAASEILSHHQIRHFFDAIVGGDEVRHGKPQPDSLLEACKRLNIAPQEAILVGDTINDKRAAKNASMFFVGYKTDGDFKIADLRDLAVLI
jgi:HAD superfamily hydrolase (TIGR01509 family)